MKIVILAGGTSPERDVSLSTGSQVYYALKEKGMQAILLDVYLGYGEAGNPLGDLFALDIDWAKDIRGVSESCPDLDQIKALRKNGGKNAFGPNVLEACHQADIVFLALHGAGGEDGRMQAAFDLMGIRYTGTDYLSSAIAMDKGITRQFFEKYQIPAPKGCVLKKGEALDPLTVSYPCMVKTACGGSSVGVYRVDGPEELPEALINAFSFGDDVIVEQFIAGREFSVGVIEGEALPVIEIAPLVGFYDYRNKYQAGSTRETCPADIPEDLARELQVRAEQVFRVLGMKSYARMDFMMEEKSHAIYCLEANTLPGMTPTSLLPQEAAAAGMGFGDLCLKIIEVSMKKYA